MTNPLPAQREKQESTSDEHSVLVLSARKDEKIVIADGRIIVKVLGIEADQVKLGFLAHPDIIIDREKVARKKKADA